MSTQAKTREPKQQRSIEKKEKIIKAGFDLICENGYHNTNTAQIAKAAGVSTGIVYQYFKDKHEILMAGMQKYSESVFFPLIDIIDANINRSNLRQQVTKLINSFIESHKMSHESHEQIMSLIHTDHEIADLFHDAELALTQRFVDVLSHNGFDKANLFERVHICVGLVDNLCHDVLFHQHPGVDYDSMKTIAVDCICNIFL